MCQWGWEYEKYVECYYPHEICKRAYFIFMKSASSAYFIHMKYTSLHILCGYARMEIQYDIYEF